MFKKIIFYILGVCFVLCLVACNKENLLDGNGDSHNEPLVIKLAYASTRTELGDDDATPRFVKGDLISVFDNSGTGSKVGVFDVKEENGIAYIEIPEEQRPEDETKMQLIYPADMYVQSPKDPFTGKITFSTSIPNVQDGKFSTANICVANDCDFSSGCAYFKLATTLLKFELFNYPEIKTLTIYSNKKLNCSSDLFSDMYFYTNVNFSEDVEDRVYYVAIEPIIDAIFIISFEYKDKVYTFRTDGQRFNTAKIYPIEFSFN